MKEIDLNSIKLILENDKFYPNSLIIEEFIKAQDDCLSDLNEEEKRDIDKFGYEYVMGL